MTQTDPSNKEARAPRLSLPAKELRRYSYARAILAAANIAERGADSAPDTLELEVSRQLAATLPKAVLRRGGLFVPTNLPSTNLRRSGLDSKTATGGGELVFTTFGGFIQALRHRALVTALGALVLPNLVGHVGLPRQTSTGQAVWVGENPGADVAETDLSLDLVMLTPKTLMSTTRFSRQLLAQLTPAVDQIVVNDLAADSAVALDRAALHGTGNDPSGSTRAPTSRRSPSAGRSRSRRSSRWRRRWRRRTVRSTLRRAPTWRLPR